MRFGWNTFTVGLAGITQFNTWTDMEYGVQIYTPILNFKQSSGVLKIHLFPDVKIITGQIFLYNITKVSPQTKAHVHTHIRTHIHRISSLFLI